MEDLDTQVSAEQEGIVGSPTDTDESGNGAGANEQGAAAPEETEEEREAKYNRGMASARRQGGRKAREEVDAEFAGVGFTDEAGKPITNSADAIAYLRRQNEQRLQAEATRQKRPVEELRQEQQERNAGREAMRTQSEERVSQEFMQQDLQEFAEAYPKVKLENLLAAGSGFVRFAGSRLGHESMTELYEDYVELTGNAGKAQKAESKAERGTGSGSGNAVEREDQHHVQHNIEAGGHGKKYQCRPGIAHGAQHGGEQIVEERKDQTAQNKTEIGRAVAGQFLRRLDQTEQWLQQRKGCGAEHQRDREAGCQHGEHALSEIRSASRAVLLTEEDGCTHAEPVEHEDEEIHHRAGDPGGGKGCSAEKAAYHEGIHGVVKLLEQAAEKQRKGQPEQLRPDLSL